MESGGRCAVLVDIGDAVRKGQPLIEIDAPELEAELATAAEQYLQAQAARFDAGIEVTTKVVRGLPADALLQHVESLERPMVVMTTHGRSGLGRVVLGSVAEKVTQASGDPVLLVRAQ